MGFYAWAVRDGDVNPFCKGNFDFDDDVDGSDAHIFKQHFGRSVFKNPCPPDGPAPLPKTGLTRCYDEFGYEINCTGTGQDGDYQQGVGWPNPRFADNGDGTVIDNLTGLIWLKNANCYGARDWIQALTDCNGLANGQCGLTDSSSEGDWRLPNLYELESLRDLRYYEPALPNTAGTGQWQLGDPFTNLIVDGYYWSSDSSRPLNDLAWGLGMFFGDNVIYDKDIVNILYVWPVRGGH